MDYEQIKKVIESCHLNFLIGSGASKPHLGTLGTIEQLLTELAKKPESDDKIVVDASIKRHYFDISIKGNLDIEKGTDPKLIATKEEYRKFFESLHIILNKRKSNLISKQVNVFTTNMDLFMEYAMEEMEFSFNDGFSGRLKPVFGTENFNNTIKKTSSHYDYQSDIPLCNLYKLHGSINWRYEDSKIMFDHGLSILKEVNAKMGDLKTFNTIENIDSQDKWHTHSIPELFSSVPTKTSVHDDFLEAYNQLIMINPTKEKFETTTRNLTFYELLRMYSNQLEKENSVLFVFGFSFADEHIREITKRVASSNPTLLIIIFAFDNASKIAIEKEISTRSNIKFIFDEKDTINYSLATINKNYFAKLAEDLEIGIKPEI